MSFIECVDNATTEGIVSKEKQQEFKKIYEEQYAKFIEQGSTPNEASVLAGKATYESYQFKANNKKRHTVLQKRAEIKAEDYLLNGYKGNDGKINPPRALELIIGFMNPRGYDSKIFLNVETRIRRVRSKLDREFSQHLIKFRHNIFGSVRNQGDLDLIGKELYQPGSTKNKAAQELAEAYTRTMELARKMYNKAGGSIPKGPFNWMPQHHNPIKIRKDFNQNEWIDFLLDNNLLATEKMINYLTGRTFSKAELRVALGEAYNNIISNGWVTKTGLGHTKNLANSRLDHRFLHFKDFDAWKKYSTLYGEPDVFSTSVAHLDKMSRDIAMMEVMGPNPAAFLRKNAALVNRWSQLQPLNKNIFKADPVDAAKSAIKKTEDMYYYLKGDLNVPYSNFWASFWGSARQLATSMYMGSAVVMASLDFNNTRIAAKFIGMPGNKAMFENFKMFVSPLGATKAEKNASLQVAMQLGFVAEQFSTIASSLARYSANDVNSNQITRRMAHFVVGSTGLSHLTQAGRYAAGKSFLMHATNLRKQSFAQLRKDKIQKDWVRALEQYGIGDKEWDIIRTTKPWDAGAQDSRHAGALFIRADDIAARTDISSALADEVANKFAHASLEFQNYAVPVGTAKGATALAGRTRPGTVEGEVFKSIMQFKQFPLVYHFTHITRGMYEKGIKGKLGYILPLIFATTMFGTFSHEMKNIRNGKDISTFEQWNNPKYWLNNMLHGGGLGFAGDILFGGRYSHDSVLGRGSEFLGPVAGLIYKFLDLTFGNVQEALDPDKEMNIGADIANFVRYNTPGGNNWYMKLVLERYLFDYISELIDPKYKSKIKRRINRTIKDEKNDYWWYPGEKSPSRAPGIN